MIDYEKLAIGMRDGKKVNSKVMIPIIQHGEYHGC